MDVPVAVVKTAPNSVAWLREIFRQDAQRLIRLARSATQKQSQSKLVNIHCAG